MKKTFVSIGKTIWPYLWPILLFIVYMIAQMLVFNYTWVSIIIAIIVASLIIPYHKVRPRQFKRKWWTKILIVFCALVALLLTLVAFQAILEHFHIKVATSRNQMIIKRAVKDNLFAMGVDTIFMAPIFEEGIFRLGMISFKNKYWLIITSILSTAFFAACHIVGSINIFVFITYMIPGLYLMLTYVYTKDVRCDILLHMLYNGLAFMVLL